jgi:hypothetical protein
MKKLNPVASSLLTLPGAGRFVLAPIARRGYRHYRVSGETPRRGYVAMRKLYAADPDAFEALAAEAGTEHENLQLPDDPPGIFHGQIDDAVRALDRDGVHVLTNLLPDATCSALVELATTSDCTLVRDGAREQRRARFDPEHVVAPRYDIDEADLLQSAAVQRLIADQSMLAVAQRYLRAAPVQDLVAMWWSAPSAAPPSSAAAQKFHFDLDRLRFLKVFVYLTDVDEHTGPHVFVKGTHARLPSRFRRDRRHEDADVESAFGESVTSITGPRGTMFVADTRGLHKGMAVDHGHRLVFQLEYASSLFGTTCPRIRLASAVSELGAAMRAYPTVYQRFATDDVA